MGLIAHASPVTPIYGGGTGTSTSPTFGYLLIGNVSNTYSFIASSSFGGSGGSGSSTTGVATSSPTTGIAYFVNGSTISGTSSYVASFNGATGTISFNANASATGTTPYVAYFVTSSGLQSTTLYFNSTTQQFSVNSSTPHADFDVQNKSSGTSTLNIGNGIIPNGSTTDPGNYTHDIVTNQSGINIASESALRVGAFNTYVGVGAGGTSTPFDYNGDTDNNFAGNANTAVGFGALGRGVSNNSTTGGYSNSAFGYLSMLDMSTGNLNTAMGNSSCLSEVSGFANSCFGVDAGFSSTGNRNTWMGNQSGFNWTSGSDNVVIGETAGFNEITGANDIIIGAGDDFASTSTTSSADIGNYLYLTGLTQNFGTDTSTITAGEFGVGTSSPGVQLSVSGTIAQTFATNTLALFSTTGTLVSYGGASGCSAGSAVTTIGSTGTTTCASFGSGNGTVTTSSATALDNFPVWSATGTTALTGTSTLTWAPGSSAISVVANNFLFSSGWGLGPSGGINNGRDLFFTSNGTGIGNTSDLANTILTIGTPTSLPTGTASSYLNLGGIAISGGQVSGTFIGINASGTSNADFVNFQANGTSELKITSSGNLTVTGSISDSQGNKYSTSTGGLASYNVTSANSFISVSTTTTSATLTFSSSSLNLGSASTRPLTDFLSSSTTYVSTFNGGTGAQSYNVYCVSGCSVATTTSAAGITVTASGGGVASTSAWTIGNIAIVSSSYALASIPTSTILAGYATSSAISAGSCTGCSITFNANGIATAFSTVAYSTVSTSTANTWSQLQSFSGGVSTTVMNATTITASGTLSVVGTSTIPNVSSTNIDATGRITVNGAKVLTSFAPSSTLASSSIAFNFYTPTTTAGYNLAFQITSNQKTITYADCSDQTATTTISLYYATSSANASANKPATTTLTSLVCGSAGNSTTSFNQAVIPAGDYLMANVSSTSGTPTHATVNITATKQ